MLLTCANRMISADYVMPLGIPSLLTNFASPTLSDSTHFIPSESTHQSIWPDYHHLLPFLSYCQALAFMPSARHLFRIRRHCSWLFFPLSFFTKGMIEGPPFRPYTSRSLLCVESEWLGGRSLWSLFSSSGWSSLITSPRFLVTIVNPLICEGMP